MPYLYLIATVIAFTFLSSSLRRYFFKPVDKSVADAELADRLRAIEKERGGRRRGTACSPCAAPPSSSTGDDGAR